MIIWIGLFVFIVGMKLQMGRLQTDRRKKKYLMIVGGVLIFFLALRGENYGAVYDLRVYMMYYEWVAITPWNQIIANPQFEMGFAILNKLLSYLSHNSQMIIIFHAMFCTYAVCRFIYRNTDEVFWAFLFFFSLGNLGFFLTALRQSIAICVCLFAVEKAKNKKVFSYAVLLVIACAIHRSALVFAPLYLLLCVDIFKKDKRMMLIPIVLMIMGSSRIIQYGKLLSDEVYAASDPTFSFNGIVPILIYAFTIVGQILFVSKPKRGKDQRWEGEAKDSYLGFAMTAMGMSLYFLRFYNMVLERISFYYIQGAPVALADVMGAVKCHRNKYIIEMVVIALCMLLFMKRLSTASYSHYIFFWQ